MVPTFEDVKAAAVRIARHAVRTPLVESPALNAATGGRIFLWKTCSAPVRSSFAAPATGWP
jgi:threonine dehydratase